MPFYICASQNQPSETSAGYRIVRSHHSRQKSSLKDDRKLDIGLFAFLDNGINLVDGDLQRLFRNDMFACAGCINANRRSKPGWREDANNIDFRVGKQGFMIRIPGH